MDENSKFPFDFRGKRMITILIESDKIKIRLTKSSNCVTTIFVLVEQREEKRNSSLSRIQGRKAKHSTNFDRGEEKSENFTRFPHIYVAFCLFRE